MCAALVVLWFNFQPPKPCWWCCAVAQCCISGLRTGGSSGASYLPCPRKQLSYPFCCFFFVSPGLACCFPGAVFQLHESFLRQSHFIASKVTDLHAQSHVLADLTYYLPHADLSSSRIDTCAANSLSSTTASAQVAHCCYIFDPPLRLPSLPSNRYEPSYLCHDVNSQGFH